MIKKIIACFVVMLVSLSLVVLADDTGLNSGDIFVVEGQNFEDTMYIIDQALCDVTGDQIEDQIFLIGSKLFSPEDIFADSLTIVVKDGSKGMYSVATEEGFCGYEGQLYLGDFTGDQVNDVLVSAPSGGSGGITYHLMASFLNGQAQLIFTDKDNMGIQVQGRYMNDFKAELQIDNIPEYTNTITLDLSDRKDIYVETEFYDQQGQLLYPVESYSNPYSLLEVIDYDKDGVLEYRGYQRVVGTSNADTLVELQSVWKYIDNEWKVCYVSVYDIIDAVYIPRY